MDLSIWRGRSRLSVQADVRHVGNLYRQIREAFVELPEQALFIGDARRQVNRADILDPTRAFEERVITGYGVEPFEITDCTSALRAIDMIVEQGEGASGGE